MLMQKYNYISEMGSNPPSYDPHRGIDLGTMPVPPPSSVAHSLAIDDKASFSASFQPFSLPVSTDLERFPKTVALLGVESYLDIVGQIGHISHHFHSVTP